MRASRSVVAVLVVILLSGVGHSGGGLTETLVHLGLVVLALLVGLVAWLVTRWRLHGGVLQIETGLVRRFSYRYPLTQIQAIDIVRPGLARVLGLAELRIRVAGAGGTKGRLAYLPLARAETLRAQLLAAAHGLPTETPAPPETPLYAIPTGRLVASLLMSGPAAILALLVAGWILLAVLAPGALAGALAGLVSTVLAIAGTLWRRFNGDYHFALAEAPDGLRVTAGLVETSAETIPRGRVQALRMVQPITWRPLRWWRVEVDVAGKATSGRQNRAAKQAGRALLPVGSREQAVWLVQRLFPGATAAPSAPPARARWKSPMRYSKLSAGFDASYAVTTSGRLRRVTDWIPLGKVQSVRWVQGPLQRRLRLASVHLDTAGRAVFAVLRDRDQDEADAWLRQLPAACGEARRLARS